MEARILAAVFASIMALAVGINGGSLNQADVQNINSQQKNILEGIFPKSIDIFSMLSNRPEPTKSVSINITAEGEETLKFSEASFTAKNMTSYSAERFSISSDSEVTLTGFNGKMVFDTNSTDVKGRASGYISSGVNSSRSFSFEKELDTSRISITGARRVKVSFDGVSGVVETASSSTSINNSNLKIDSFSGNITVYPEQERFVFEGKINELNAGSLTLKAEEN
ncbi:hypothetical protein GKQ38_01495 [Candidatus Nanohaloarchaea archaeon]|nr:hypothetical protein GKQ38_01495 [Candidatus Nanohaloarchaea archaeon]